MRTVNFRTFIEEQYLPALGKSPDDHAPGTLAADRQVGYINDALVEACQYAFWRELMVIESRDLDVDGVLTSTASGKTDIHSIYGIYTTEADAIAERTPLEYVSSPDGWRVFGAVDTVIVRLRPYPPAFTFGEWGWSREYTENARCYSASTGTCYRARSAHSGQDPDSDDGTYWAAEILPELFVPYLKEKAKAADLYFERKYDAAGVAESRANRVLFNLKESKGL